MKKSLVLLIGLLTCLTVASQPIESNAAKRKAMRFMRQEKLMLVAQSATDNPTYYVFNSTDRQRGFVIVSGEENTDEILGYADSGTFDPESMPEALRWWLQCYDEQIKMLRSKKATAVTATTSKKAISPLVATKWGQNDPFNNQSPVYKITYNETTHKNDTTYYVTGCVATAMAQIMKYWSYNKATAAIPAYTSYTRDIERPALPATIFNYAAMKNAYNSNERGAAVDAVAKLMKYCGQSVEMDYNTGGSSASMSTESFINYFGYDTGATIVGRATYTTSEWEDIIYNELAAKRPVLYSGKSPTSGHAFICDGYDGNGLFHINWG